MASEDLTSSDKEIHLLQIQQRQVANRGLLDCVRNKSAFVYRCFTDRKLRKSRSFAQLSATRVAQDEVLSERVCNILCSHS